MALKIKRIYVQNFKVFTEFSCDFDQSDLLLFDGPNGFGKTSFYDAVELLITGTIKRYERLTDQLIDGRVTYTENPYLNTQNPNGNIIIKAELQIDEITYILSRKGLFDELENSARFNKFKLYRHEEFESAGELISDEKDFLERLLGTDYKANFEFLNYIEQEDNAFLLKNSEKNKKDMISHLFNVSEFQSRIDKYEALRKRVLELGNAEAKKGLEIFQTELKEHKQSLKESNEIGYQTLFRDATPLWDAQEIKFIEGIYKNWFEDQGEITLLERLIGDKDNYQSYRFNKGIKNSIENREKIDDFLRYAGFISTRTTLADTKRILTEINSTLDAFEEITTFNLVDEEYELSENIQRIFNEIDSTGISNYNNGLLNVRNKRSKATELSKLLADLKSSRDQLVARFKLYQNALEETQTDCPLCGYDWTAGELAGNDDLLMINIEKQTQALESIVQASNDDLGDSVSDFKENMIGPLQQLFEDYLEKNELDYDFVDALSNLDLPLFERRIQFFKDLDLDYVPFLNSVVTENAPLKTQELIDELTLKLKPVNEEDNLAKFDEVYSKFFKKDEELFLKITPLDLANKIKYIDWQYAIYQNNLIKTLQTDYDLKVKQYNDAKSLGENLKDIIDIYKTSLSNYNKKLIRDLEILFHIYSGRIVQDFQGGLGLFIKEDKGIKFLTDPTKSFDAVFSMSSGQLSALIISFTLALNKKYSKNNILFIDDPVQSMDELNMAGFIEVLRNDFSDRQIFISTHEDMMSSFMRYKFQKFGLKTKRINMKSVL